VLVSPANQQIAGEVRLVQALLDDDLMTLRRIIEARAHGTNSTAPVRSVSDTAWSTLCGSSTATFSRSRRHRHDDPVAGPVIFKPLLLVLIVSELEPIAPALLIPVRPDQASAFQTITDRQWLTVTLNNHRDSGCSIHTQAGQNTPVKSDLA
jgi:hypothetical protein